ncbi:hypothetical protein ACFVWX_13500 [Streptomyces sp. NPDC058220]|uniref:hypothetical protein n=1 Tax=Streptomyces sp. NPDC058220 TaxID=3346387 RepID=UPI0036E7143B
MQIDFVRLATPRTLSVDAYREFCWGVGLPETREGYGLLCGHHDDGRLGTAVLDDVEYARLLAHSGGGVVVPAEKALATIDDWPDLRPSAASVWD